MLLVLYSDNAILSKRYHVTEKLFMHQTYNYRSFEYIKSLKTHV